ncbi:SDR family NAD(P)-dependent oxidoreductase [Galbitalea sp. SE-J8]|uniref:SDR family NAD(P)-dependent oxidoreductase n=1 Tax=Galbitalea sp. SE-J8 TaxID=3054952 RepID=UPI00259D0DBF|nr:SDR family NAD(P)-dependent oxidoreductase [Galbitalea sp. SE-J8]MDM4761544.1 SDR family NAD(P)-dependent oxidoreductase [Galbitalea sp. SE-J8]
MAYHPHPLLIGSPMSERLSGHTALVTGAASGIGRVVADRFAAEGARVVYADIDVRRVRAAAGSTADRRWLEMDIADESAIERVFGELVRAGWSPDIVVANAGVQLFGQDAPAAELDLAVWRRTLDINLTGTFLTVKHAVRAMLAGHGGSVILTGSPTGIRGGGADFTAYSVSKAGIHGLTRTVAAAYARSGIRVNAVVPAYTETPLVDTLAHDPAARASLIDAIPMGRAGVASDVEGIMVYLASDESGFSTGGLFEINGGSTTL